MRIALLIICLLYTKQLIAREEGVIVLDPSLPPPAGNTLGGGWSYGGFVETRLRVIADTDLNATNPDTVLQLRPQISLSLKYDPGNRLRAEGVLRYRHLSYPVDTGEQESNRHELFLSSLNLTWQDVIPRLDLTLGRFQLQDRRNWLFKEDMDGIKLDYQLDNGAVFFTVNKLDTLPINFSGGDDSDDFINYILYWNHQPADENYLDAYVIARDHEHIDVVLPVLLGVRSGGTVSGKLDYWLELGGLLGKTVISDQKQINRGWGLELGGTYNTSNRIISSLTASYAYGSGDKDTGDGTNKAFSQSLIGDSSLNEHRWEGLNIFDTYGTVFRPNLSNLQIFTLGAGVKPLPKTSIEIVFHKFRQVETQPQLDTGVFLSTPGRIDTEPDGISKDIGTEIDLVIGIKEHHRLEIEFEGGVFFPGKAYQERKNAFFGELKFKYNF